MAFQLSPGINVSEIDLTTIVPSVATSIGGFAGIFNWGPVSEVVTISDEVRLVDRFGKPDTTNYEYWFSAANFLAYSNNIKVVRAANTTSTLNATANGTGVLIKNTDDYVANRETATNTAYGPFGSRYAGALGNSLRISICPSSQAYSSNLSVTDSITVTRSGTSNTSVDVTGGSPVANVYVGDLISFDNGTSYVRTTNVGATFINVASAVAITAGSPILRKWQYAAEFGVAPGTSDYTSVRTGSGDEMHIIVVDEDGKFSATANTVLEKYAFVSKASDAINNSGSSTYYKTVINSQSRYVWWLTHQPGGTNWGNTAQGIAFTNINTPFSASFAAGADGSIGTNDIVTAYQLFANPDYIDVSLLVSGPGNSTVASSLISLAEGRKDCLAFISPTKASVVNNAGYEATSVISFRNGLTSSSYAVIDSGYKYQFDRYNNVYRWIPLNGDIAGTCARTDLQRDPWYSPGGLNRGVIKNVIKLSWNPSQTDRDNMYVVGVNPVVTFPGEGTILFGDKTMLSKPSAFDRINVRRLFVVLEKSIAKAARSTLFEFNDQFTRASFVNLVEPFLRDVQGRRGITDFRVVCDTTNNTAEVIDSNRFVGDIYIKPARSINYIQLNFVAVRTGVSFEEIVGRF